MKTKAVAMMFAVALCATALAAGPAANAETPSAPSPVTNADINANPNSPLDPQTFAGELVVATPQGEVRTRVESGQAPPVIKSIQDTEAHGVTPPQGEVVEPGSGCGETVRSVAGPGVWWTSVQGLCSVRLSRILAPVQLGQHL